MGVHPLSTGLNLYGETGLMGYSLERELASNVNDSGWDDITRKQSGSLYGEVGLRYDIGAVELSTGYRYANMTDDMHDFRRGGLQADPEPGPHRRLHLSQLGSAKGSISSLA